MVGLTRLSLKNRSVLALLSLVIVGFGLFSMLSLRQEFYPSFEMKQATIVTVYPGATPQTVERDVTKPVEDAVKAVGGVTKVSSVSTSNASQITAEWDFKTKTTEIEPKIRAAADGVAAQLPKDVKPKVVIGNIDDIPVVALAVSSAKQPEDLASDLKAVALPKLKAVPGVREVSLSGEQVRNVVITTRQADLDRFGVDASQLQQVMEAYKMVIPAGDIKQSGSNLNVQVGKTLTSVQDVQGIQLQGKDHPVALREVADVVSSPAESTSISRVNGQPAVGLAVQKTQDANTVTVAHEVDKVLPGIEREIGHNTKFTTTFSFAPYIEQSIEQLGVEGGLGLLMAVIVIMVFLWSLRTTLITALSIPMSLLIALIALYAGNYTLNLLTLSALTVAVGRVVDDSIVVVENIKRHMTLGEEFGVPLIIQAVREVASAVTASTITTVAVFLPLGLVSGQAGELFRPFAVTVTAALLASLIVSLTIVPMLASWFLKPTRKQLALQQNQPVRASHESDVTGMQKAYLPALRFSLKRPIVVLVAAVLVFVGTMAMAGRLKTEFLGDSGQGVYVYQTLPVGTNLESTDASVKGTEAVLAADPAVKTYQVTIGGGREGSFSGAASKANKAEFTIDVKEGDKPTDVANRLRSKLVDSNKDSKFEVVTAGGSGMTQNLEVQIKGQNEADIAVAAPQVAEIVRASGATDVKSDLGETEKILQVNVNEAEAAKYGMSQGTVGPAVMASLKGVNLGTVVIGDKSQEMLLRSRTPLKTKQDLESMELPVTQVQTANAQKAAADQLEAEQTAEANKQLDKQEEQLADQRDKVVEGRNKAQQQLSDLQDKLNQMKNPPAVPVNPAVAAQAQGAAQVQEMEKSIDGIRQQITEANKQLDQLDEQRQELADQRVKQAETRDKSKAAKDAKGTPVMLGQVAQVVEVPVVANVRHLEGVRTVTVSGTPQGGDIGAATTSINQGLTRLHLPTGVTAEIGGVSQQQNEAFGQLFMAMAVAIAIVYMVMVATFRSLLQPLILLVSIPFAATGAVGLLLLTNTPLGLPAMIGLLMLIGIVVTNAIVLIDLVNHYRSQGASIDDAVIHGARLRLRPIVMTALATIMALVPMATGLTGAGFFISQSLAVVVIGGLISSTLLTLILVPVLYHVVEKLRERTHRKGGPTQREPDERTTLEPDERTTLNEMLDGGQPAGG